MEALARQINNTLIYRLRLNTSVGLLSNFKSPLLSTVVIFNLITF